MAGFPQPIQVNLINRKYRVVDRNSLFGTEAGYSLVSRQHWELLV